MGNYRVVHPEVRSVQRTTPGDWNTPSSFQNKAKFYRPVLLLPSLISIYRKNGTLTLLSPPTSYGSPTSMQTDVFKALRNTMNEHWVLQPIESYNRILQCFQRCLVFYLRKSPLPQLNHTGKILTNEKLKRDSPTIDHSFPPAAVL